MEGSGKGGGAKADGGRKIKGEHKDAVFFVDVIFALAVFVTQRDQGLRDPLTGIDEDLAGLGSLGEILFLHIFTFLQPFTMQVAAAPPILELLSIFHLLCCCLGELLHRPPIEQSRYHQTEYHLDQHNFVDPAIALVAEDGEV